MTSNAIAKLVALGIGALIVVQALNSASSSLSTLEKQSEVTLWALSIPIFISLCFAVFLYRYASRLELKAGPSSTRSLMWAGFKLMGIYLVVMGLPGVLAGLGLLAFNSMVGGDSSNTVAAVYTSISGSVQTMLGLILLFATKKLVEMSGADDAYMALKAFAPRVAHLDRLHQRCVLQRGRLTRCYASDAEIT